MKKKDIIILSVSILAVLLIFGLLLFMSSKADTNEDATTEENNYATNEVIDDTTEEITEEPTEPDDSTVSDNSIEDKLNPTYTFNVKEDVNYNNENLTADTFSIDGKIVSFPCSYSHLREKFGVFYSMEAYNQLVMIKEETLNPIKVFEAYAIPETGEGSIVMYFVSPTGEAENVMDLICTKIVISGRALNNDSIMTMAMKDNIHFGSTPEEIFAAFGKVTKDYTNNDSGSFTITYEPDGTKNKYYFVGENNGLVQVVMEYEYNQE